MKRLTRFWLRVRAQVHTLFAHKLTTVWCVPEGNPPRATQIGPSDMPARYGEQWPSYQRMLATLIKPSNLCDTNAWPQLLELGAD